MPSSVFNGTAVKILKKILRFKDSNVEIITGDTDDPTSVAKSAPQGSIYIRSGTGVAYIKQDSGSSTNWNEIADSADLSGKANVALDNILPTTSVDFNSQKLIDVADPTTAQEAATKNYVDTNFVPDTEKGAALGVATLDAGGKVPVSQLPNSIMEYQGTWNASTNTPTLADGVGSAGDVYIVSVGGTQNLGSGAITFAAGDWIVYNGATWEKSVNSNAVASVNGFTGVVVLTADDVGAADQSLSNLTTTSINAALIPDSNNVHDLGTDTEKWNNQYVNQIMDASTVTAAIDPNQRLLFDSTGYNSLDFENRWLTDAAGDITVDYGQQKLQSGVTTKLDWGGTDISVNTRKLIDVVDPTNLQDAATKNYVDNADSAKVAGPVSSVASEIVLFDGITGKLVKAATGTGIVKATSGVYGTGNVSLTSEVTGTLPVANGGTNSATTLNNNRIMISSSGSIVEQTALTASAPMRTNASGLPTTGSLNLATETTGTLPFNSVGYESVVTKTTTATLALTESIVLVDATSGSFTVTLPTAVGNTGKVYKIKKINAANAVTIDGNGSETIDGNANVVMSARYDHITISSNGTNWDILDWGISVGLRVGATNSNFNATEATQVFGTVTTDTHSGYSAGTYTIPYNGYYHIYAQCAPGGTLSTAQSATLKIRVDSTTVAQCSINGTGVNANWYPSISDSRFLGAGSTVDVRGIASVALTNANSTVTDIFVVSLINKG